jgi:hypothetical protein
LQELGVAKNMQIEKKSHDAIPQLQDQLAKAKYQLATVQVLHMLRIHYTLHDCSVM